MKCDGDGNVHRPGAAHNKPIRFALAVGAAEDERDILGTNAVVEIHAAHGHLNELKFRARSIDELGQTRGAHEVYRPSEAAHLNPLHLLHLNDAVTENHPAHGIGAWWVLDINLKHV